MKAERRVAIIGAELDLGAGRLPTKQGEAVINDAFVARGVAIGDTLDVLGEDITVVGTGRDASHRDALTVAVAARKLGAYGMDARHLRAIKQAAEREAALVDLAVSAHSRRRHTSRQELADVMQLVLYAHAALLRSSIST